MSPEAHAKSRSEIYDLEFTILNLKSCYLVAEESGVGAVLSSSSPWIKPNFFSL